MSITESTMAMSAYLLATAVGPLFIGPLSEIWGRKWIIHFTNVWFLVWNLVGGFANGKGLLIASRLLAGFGASAVFSVASGVLGDVWSHEQRGRSIGYYILLPILGAAVGPILGGFITDYTSWRWMFWSTSVLQAVLTVGCIPVVGESYAPLLLRRRARKLRLERGDSRYYAEIETKERGRSAAWKLRNALSRPFRLLLFHPVVQIQSVLSGINYGLLYIALSSFSTLFVTVYSESISISGLHYLSLCLGEIAGAQLCGPLMDYWHKRMKAHAGGETTPEMRVPLTVPGALLTPVGFLIYGWASQYTVFWFVVDLGAFVLALGLQMFGMALYAYTIDSYPEHVSSAMAAVQFTRSLTAFAFPLFAPTMYEQLGYGWGNTLLALMFLAIGAPALGLLFRFGARLRKGKESY